MQGGLHWLDIHAIVRRVFCLRPQPNRSGVVLVLLLEAAALAAVAQDTSRDDAQDQEDQEHDQDDEPNNRLRQRAPS